MGKKGKLRSVSCPFCHQEYIDPELHVAECGKCDGSKEKKKDKKEDKKHKGRDWRKSFAILKPNSFVAASHSTDVTDQVRDDSGQNEEHVQKRTEGSSRITDGLAVSPHDSSSSKSENGGERNKKPARDRELARDESSRKKPKKVPSLGLSSSLEGESPSSPLGKTPSQLANALALSPRTIEDQSNDHEGKPDDQGNATEKAEGSLAVPLPMEEEPTGTGTRQRRRSFGDVQVTPKQQRRRRHVPPTAPLPPVPRTKRAATDAIPPTDKATRNRAQSMALSPNLIGAMNSPKTMFLAHLINDLNEANFEHADLRDGIGGVIPILDKYADDIVKMDQDNSGKRKKVKPEPITVNFPDEKEFRGIRMKSFKFARNHTVQEFIVHVCKGMGLDDASPYCLLTKGGVKLYQNKCISQYGLGTLFNTWEVNLVSNDHAPDTVTGDSGGVRSMAQKTSICLLKIVFPSTDAFRSVDGSHRLLQVEPRTTLHRIVNALCRKLHVRYPERYVLASEQRPGSFIVLDCRQDLAYFGLGKRFKKWALHLMEKSSAEKNYSCNKPMARGCAWTQLKEGKLSLPEAQAIIEQQDTDISHLQRQFLQLKKHADDRVDELLEENNALLAGYKEVTRLKQEEEKYNIFLREEWKSKLDESKKRYEEDLLELKKDLQNALDEERKKWENELRQLKDKLKKKKDALRNQEEEAQRIQNEAHENAERAKSQLLATLGQIKEAHCKEIEEVQRQLNAYQEETENLKKSLETATKEKEWAEIKAKQQDDRIQQMINASDGKEQEMETRFETAIATYEEKLRRVREEEQETRRILKEKERSLKLQLKETTAEMEASKRELETRYAEELAMQEERTHKEELREKELQVARKEARKLQKKLANSEDVRHANLSTEADLTILQKEKETLEIELIRANEEIASLKNELVKGSEFTKAIAATSLHTESASEPNLSLAQEDKDILKRVVERGLTPRTARRNKQKLSDATRDPPPPPTPPPEAPPLLPSLTSEQPMAEKRRLGDSSDLAKALLSKRGELKKAEKIEKKKDPNDLAEILSLALQERFSAVQESDDELTEDLVFAEDDGRFDD